MKKILLFILTSIVFTIICLSVQNTYSIYVKTVNSDITLTTTKLEATFLPGQEFNAKIKQLAGNSGAASTTQDTNITSIVRSNTLTIMPTTDNVVSTSDSPFPIYAWFSNGTLYYYTEVANPYTNQNAREMFRGLRGLTNIEISTLNTINTNSIWAMFYQDINITTIDLSNFDTRNLVIMRDIFKGCTSLQSVDLTGFNTSNVENMYGVFTNTSIEYLDISMFDMNKVTDTTGMLSGLNNLKELKTPKVYPSDTSVTLTLTNTMYDDNSVGYSVLGKSTTPSSPTQTWIKEGYIVTFNSNGGTVSPTTKVVKYDENYDLPTPTRSGYQFLGWNGKNKFNKSKYLNKENYTIKNSANDAYNWAEIDLEPNKTYKVSVKRYNNYDGKTNTIILSKTKSPGVDGGWSAIAHTTAPNNSQTGYMYTINSGEKLYIGYYNTMTQAEMDTIWANTDVQIEEGTIATEYEPYYVTNSTKVTKLENHTLNAEWIDNQAPTLTLEKWTYKEGFDGASLSNAYVDGDGVLVLGENGNAASATLNYTVNRGKNYITFDGWTNTASPNNTPKGGILVSLSYKDINGNSMTVTTANGKTYSGNGWAAALDLNQWQEQRLTYGTYIYGYDIGYYTFSTGNNDYSNPITKIRNFKFWADDLSNSFYFININSSDNEGIVETKYAKGNQNKSYFESNGRIINNDQIEVNENGIYTVFVRDAVGNSTIETIEITRITNTPWNYAYNGTDGSDGRAQVFTAPVTGTYQIEAWGAEGGTKATLHNDGLGGYTKGNLHLDKGDTLYIYVGGHGDYSQQAVDSIIPGGYNGGGQARGQNGQTRNYGSGGGATDIRLINGNWDSFDSLKTRIMVAAGGGGTWVGDTTLYGGSGGGLNGYNGTDHATYTPSWGTSGTGATQTSGGYSTTGSNTRIVRVQDEHYNVGQFGKTTWINYEGGYTGGGSGYYAGGGSMHVQSAGGGSSFISGYSGCNAISSSSTENNIVHTNQPNFYNSDYIFTSSVMIDGKGCNWSTGSALNCGTNQPQPDGTTSIGHLGNGYARITLVNLE